MKPKARTAIIVLLPFFLMIVVNESFRSFIKERPFYYFGFKTINSNDRIKYKCTWNCHNNTFFCKAHHVKFLNKSFKEVSMHVLSKKLQEDPDKDPDLDPK